MCLFHTHAPPVRDGIATPANSCYLREGVVTSNEQSEKEEVAKLLRFESSRKPVGETVSLADYVRGMSNTQRDIFYLAAPTRYSRCHLDLEIRGPSYPNYYLRQ